MKSVRAVCAHDCPDMCSLMVQVEDGRIVRVQGDPDHPYTAGFACGKVNRDADLVNSPERITTPLRRNGAKGTGRFTPNIDGPNPQRKFSRNNYGDVWVVATAKDEKDKDGKPLVGKSYLVVTVPTYIKWDQPEVTK